eukprot:254245-Pyramimonas_sp.AAC.1
MAMDMPMAIDRAIGVGGDASDRERLDSRDGDGDDDVLRCSVSPGHGRRSRHAQCAHSGARWHIERNSWRLFQTRTA